MTNFLYKKDGSLSAHSGFKSPIVLLPGSFNPVHSSHLEIACFCEKAFNVPVVFEICRNNVDKGEISPEEIRSRALAINSFGFDVVSTNWDTFSMKSSNLTQDSVIACGRDTYRRVISPEYYQNSTVVMNRCVQSLCTVLVFPRGLSYDACLTQYHLDTMFANKNEFDNIFFVHPEKYKPNNISSSKIRKS